MPFDVARVDYEQMAAVYDAGRDHIALQREGWLHALEALRQSTTTAVTDLRCRDWTVGEAIQRTTTLAWT